METKSALQSPKSRQLQVKTVHFGEVDEVHEGPEVEESPLLPPSTGFNALMKQRKVCSKGLQFLSTSITPTPQESDLVLAPRPVSQPTGKFRYGSLRQDIDLNNRFKHSPPKALSPADDSDSSSEQRPLRFNLLGLEGYRGSPTNLADRFKSAAASACPKEEVTTPTLGLMGIQGWEVDVQVGSADNGGPEIQRKLRWGSQRAWEDAGGDALGLITPGHERSSEVSQADIPELFSGRCRSPPPDIPSSCLSAGRLGDLLESQGAGMQFLSAATSGGP